MTIRVTCPTELAAEVRALLCALPAASAVVVYRGAGVQPSGDVVEVDLPREAVNDVVDALVGLGVPEHGTVQLVPVSSWISAPALRAEQRAPGASSDAVVWTDVVQRAYEETSLTWTYLSFMVLATLLAAIAILTDSVILVIGAMVLGPEFVAVAGLGVAIVRRRWHLLRRSARALVVGFAVSIAAVAAIAAVARWLGLVDYSALLTSARPGTSFIFEPSAWSLVVAVIAGAAGVLALTSARSGGLVGVFISVTTIPASGNIALALVFGMWREFWGSTLTLVVNIVGMALAGWATLAFQQHVWARVSTRRHHLARAFRHRRDGPNRR